MENKANGKYCLIALILLEWAQCMISSTVYDLTTNMI